MSRSWRWGRGGGGQQLRKIKYYWAIALLKMYIIMINGSGYSNISFGSVQNLFLGVRTSEGARYSRLFRTQTDHLHEI